MRYRDVNPVDDKPKAKGPKPKAGPALLSVLRSVLPKEAGIVDDKRNNLIKKKNVSISVSISISREREKERKKEKEKANLPTYLC